MQTPLVEAIAVVAAAPSLGDNTGDVDRLKRALPSPLATAVVPFAHLAVVGERFRAAGFAGAAVVNHLAGGVELVDFLPALPEQLPAMALDLGTTHLEATLLDLRTGTRLARATRPNSQAEHGADILSRIHFAAKGEGLATLQQAVVADINDLAAALATQAGIVPAAIRALSVAGNTTMVHLFLGINPYHLCREPYIPMVNTPDPCHGADLGLAIHPAAPVWVLPSIGSYFGGDLLAGIVASNLDQEETTSMLIDVGTNAEVVVGNREWLIACAGAAGPALEGGVARMGMRAGPGAIDQVTVEPETRAIRYRTIGNEKPRGLCGSGIIDLVAGLYLARMIDIRGKFRPLAMGERLLAGLDGPALLVAPAEEAADGKPVVLSQIDLDALMRSKAAMYAILTTLMHQVGMPFTALHKIYVAGAFGRHIAPRQAIVLGMLPDLPIATYQAIGNSSLAGAELVLTDGEARRRAQALVRKITYVELNVNQEFMIRFSGSRFIPHTDHQLFPSVPFYSEE